MRWVKAYWPGDNLKEYPYYYPKENVFERIHWKWEYFKIRRQKKKAGLPYENIYKG